MTFVVGKDCINCKHTTCVQVCPVDCFYEGKNIPSDKKSIALKVTIQSDHKTLNENDLSDISKRIIKSVEEKTSAKLRS